MKIYTKKGDNGNTTVIGGLKLRKDNIVIEAYGTIDELIAHLGRIFSLEKSIYYFDIVKNIQDKLMLCAANLANVSSIKEKSLKNIEEEDVKYIEKQIDILDKDIESLENFVLFQGQLSSSFNILRTITRRAERETIRAFYSGYTHN